MNIVLSSKYNFSNSAHRSVLGTDSLEVGSSDITNSDTLPFCKYKEALMSSGHPYRCKAHLLSCISKVSIEPVYTLRPCHDRQTSAVAWLQQFDVRKVLVMESL